MDRRQLELALSEEKYLTVNVRSHPLAPFREELGRLGFITSRELRRKRKGSRVKVAGRVILVHTPPTRSGVRVMFITAEDEYGLIDMTMLPEVERRCARTVISCPLCAFEGTVRKHGRAASVVLEEVRELREVLRSRSRGCRG